MPVQFPGAKFVPSGPIVKRAFGNGRIAIGVDDGEGALCRLNVNLADDVAQAPDEVAIKDYSENEGVLDALMEAGIVSAPVRYEQSGYVDFPICKLLVDL